MNNNLQRCLKNINILKNRAKQCRHFQNMMLLILLVSIIFLSITNFNIFKIFSIVFSLFTLFSIFYLTTIIDPLWDEEIQKYRDLLNKQ